MAPSGLRQFTAARARDQRTGGLSRSREGGSGVFKCITARPAQEGARSDVRRLPGAVGPRAVLCASVGGAAGEVGAGEARRGALLRRFDGRGGRCFDEVVRRRAGAARPLHGRVKGARAFEGYVTDLNAWLAQHNMSFAPVDHVITQTWALEEVVLHLDGQA